MQEALARLSMHLMSLFLVKYTQERKRKDEIRDIFIYLYDEESH